MKINLSLAGAVLCAVLCSCAKAKGGGEELLEARTVTVKKSAQNFCLDTFGSVTYKRKNEVTALVEGTVYELNVQEGSKVCQGDVLLRMKNVQYEIQKAEFQNQLNSAKARLRAAKNNLTQEELGAQSRMLSLENARASLAQKKEELDLSKKNLEKNRSLFEAGGISESAFEKMSLECQAVQTEVAILEKEIKADEMGFRDQDLLAAGMEPSEDSEEKARQLVELNVQSAKIQIELCAAEAQNAEENLRSINSLMENLTLRSPMSGVVGTLNVENGERVTQNQKALTIIDMSEPFAQVTVQEKDMEKIALGSPALVEIESLGQNQKSAVSFISPLADYETGNFFIKIPLKNAEENLRFGMFAQCSIETNKRENFFAAPPEAILGRNGNNIVFYCVKNGYVFQKECPIEMERNGKIFISGGIEDGEKIVVNPSSAIKEGVHVKEI